MGNCCYPASSSSSSTVCDKDTQASQLTLVEAPIRFGAEGLFDCGFEYRNVASDHVSARAEDSLDDITQQYNLRLFHIETGVMISSKNRRIYIPDGKIFDMVATCCQQFVQQRLQEEFGMKWIDLFTLDDDGDSDNGQTIKALSRPAIANMQSIETADDKASNKSPTPILVVCTGKGKSRAGVLSVKELLESGLLQGSAIYHIKQAIHRGWAVLLLDPNARGKMQSQALIRSSLTHFHLHWTEFGRHPLYILAHSASGGALVRYLVEGDHRHELLSGIQRCAFTDSTHHIQWASEDKALASFLQSNRVLYIRNCSERASDTFANHKHKKAGECHEGDCWWKRRFGQIPTVWAGTTSHSAMCWVARNVIWDFFDRDQQK